MDKDGKAKMGKDEAKTAKGSKAGMEIKVNTTLSSACCEPMLSLATLRQNVHRCLLLDAEVKEEYGSGRWHQGGVWR